MNTHTATETRGKQGQFREHVDNIKSDASNLKADASDLAGDVAGAAGAATTEAQQRAKELAHTGAEKATEIQDSFNDTIRRNPTASVLIALGAGLVVGRFLNSGR